MHPRQTDNPVRITRHWTTLVYPFRHLLADLQPDVLSDLDSRWQPFWARLTDNVEAAQRAYGSTRYFLPHVRELLFPESRQTGTADANDGKLVASLWGRMTLHQFFRIGRGSTDHTSGFVRLTLRPDCLQPFHNLRLFSPGFEADIQTNWIDILTCPSGIGLLLWNVSAVDLPMDQRQLVSLFHWMRRLVPVSVGAPVARWTIGAPSSDGHSDGASFQSVDLVDFLLQRIAEPGRVEHDDFAGYLETTGTAGFQGGFSLSKFAAVYGQAFRLYSFVIAEQAGMLPMEGSVFQSSRDRMLYELATGTDTSEATFQPDERFAAELLDAHRIAIWNNWQAIALQQNVVFAGFADTPGAGERQSGSTGDFLPGPLQHSVAWNYFYLFLLVEFQRIWINIGFGDLIRQGKNVDRDWSAVKAIWNRFLQFENCFWYREVTDAPQGTVLFEALQRGLRVPELFDELESQLSRLHEHYATVVSRRTDVLLQLLAVIGLPIAIATSVYSTNLVDDLGGNWLGFSILLVGLSLALGLVTSIWRRWYRG